MFLSGPAGGDSKTAVRLNASRCRPRNRTGIRRRMPGRQNGMEISIPDFPIISYALKCKRKFALRFGKLNARQAKYTLDHNVVKKLCSGDKTWADVTEKDFKFSVDQKGVDMKIGLDIASMAYKKQVSQIVLISGDSDFVAAAKLARREGIDFILDPLGPSVKEELREHVDGLRTCDSAYKK